MIMERVIWINKRLRAKIERNIHLIKRKMGKKRGFKNDTGNNTEDVQEVDTKMLKQYYNLFTNVLNKYIIEHHILSKENKTNKQINI